MSRSPQIPIQIQKNWRRFFDELVPNHVLKHYRAPGLRNCKKFDERAAEIYLESIAKLSETFTVDRTNHRAIRDYIHQKRFRAAYLLYFMPLHCAKIFSILNQVKLSRPPRRVVDLGAGPGTASMALMFYLKMKKIDFSKIEWVWIDQNESIMRDGVTLARSLWGENLKIRLSKKLKPEKSADFLLSTHFLNEAVPSPEKACAFLRKFFGAPKEPGWLLVEPAARTCAQLLSKVRDRFLDGGSFAQAPCLHHGPCPLSKGRDWCHFSQKTPFQTKWMETFGRSLRVNSSEIKYSFVWMSSKKPPPTNKRLILSNALSGRAGKGEYLVCQPERVERIQSRKKLRRGDLLCHPAAG